MSRMIIRLVFVIVGAALGYYILPEFYDYLPFNVPMIFDNAIAHFIIFGFIFFILATMVENYILKALYKLEQLSKDLQLSYIIIGAVGAVIGLVIAWLINLSLMSLQIPFISNVLPIVITIVFAYLGFSIATNRRDEISSWFNQRNGRQEEEEQEVLADIKDSHMIPYKVLDTSAIIDGRIKEVLNTGFLEGTFIVSNDVLQELQHIADSADHLKREKGRRGLDILNDLQNDDRFKLEMYQDQPDKDIEVDQKLVNLASRLQGALVTTDYNLNKVAAFQNVPVLNINDLANSVKPVVIAGEEMTVTVVKEGTERQQGVGYLSDGTMVIVEDGRKYMHQPIDTEVTSTIQTSAGRMIFTKPTDKWLKEHGH